MWRVWDRPQGLKPRCIGEPHVRAEARTLEAGTGCFGAAGCAVYRGKFAMRGKNLQIVSGLFTGL